MFNRMRWSNVAATSLAAAAGAGTVYAAYPYVKGLRPVRKARAAIKRNHYLMPVALAVPHLCILGAWTFGPFATQRALQRWFVLRPRSAGGSFASTFGHMFSHKDVNHVLGSFCITAISCGPVIAAVGPDNAFAVYFLSGLAGAVSSVAFAPILGAMGTLGSSGAYHGLFACSCWLAPKMQYSFFGIAQSPLNWWETYCVYGLWLVAAVVMRRSVPPTKDLWCHLGGFLGGSAMGQYLSQRRSRVARRRVGIW